MKKNKYIFCACGCGERLKQYNKWGKKRRFINHHQRGHYKTKQEYKEHRKTYQRERQRQRRKFQGDEVRKYDRDRSHNIKVELINLLGNKCKICGIKYNGKNGAIFQFHHRNPEEKDHDLSFKNLKGKAKEKIINEVKKCDLLCANCHSLFHAESF